VGTDWKLARWNGNRQELLRAGHHVTLYNRTRERAEALRKDGAAVAGSVAELAAGMRC